MRYRLLASYQGAPYEAGLGPEESGVVLFAACPPPEDLHFEPATGHWRKTVRRGDVQSLYESRPVGLFRGERCVVLDDLTDRLHIAYLGHDALKAEQLGYWEVDRGVFELIAPRQDVTDIVEQRLPVGEPEGGGHASPLANGSAGDHLAGLDHLDPYPASAGTSGGTSMTSAPDGPAYGPSRSGYGSQSQNGHRPSLLPRAGELPGDGRGVRHEPGLPEPAGPVSIPAADAPPLPLEAEAMRAATASARRGKDAARTDRAPAASDLAQPGTAPSVPRTPAGLSEPSTAVRTPGGGARGVPSWTPQPQVPPQRPAQAENGEGPSGSGTAARYGEPGGTAARGSAHGRASAQALADAPPLDAYQQNGTEIQPAGTRPGTDSDSPGAPAPAAAPAAPSAPSAPSAPPAPSASLAPSAPLEAADPPVPLPAPPPAQADGQFLPAAPAVPEVATASEPGVPALASPAGQEAAPAERQPERPQAGQPERLPAGQPEAAEPASRGRRSARRRLSTQRIFSELAGQAGIPAHTYAIGEDVEGAMCLVQTDDGFEVFNSLGGARHEVRVFTDEESAYFYLFGILAAEALRTGRLGMLGPRA